jgi:uncharacterized protein
MIIEVKGNRFKMFPEKALLWVDRKTLILSDLHLGKSSFFRTKGIAAPEGDDEGDLKKIKNLIKISGAERVIILGDLFHMTSSVTKELIDGFLQAIGDKHLSIVKGNHDRIKLFNNSELREKLVSLIEEENFIFSHAAFNHNSKYIISGHIHPSVYLKGSGKMRERLPCFYFSDSIAVLPSFGSFTGSYLIKPLPGDRVFVPAEDSVIEIEYKKLVNL